MKYPLYLTLLLVLFCSCGHNDHSASQRMSRVEDLIWTHPDSAHRLMETIVLEEPVSPPVRARHALLTVQTRSRMRIPATSDSLIRVALDYYENRSYSQPELLMWAYLYHADVLLDLGKHEDATVPLKKAESLIRKDTPLPYRFLIESNLGFINRRSGLYNLAYKHHQTAYHLAECRQDTLWMMTAVANLMALRGYDTTTLSRTYTFEKLERLLPQLPLYLQGKLWQNAGVYYSKNRDTLTAMQCYHHALSIDPTLTSTQLTLGIMYEKQGNFPAADSTYAHILRQGNASQKSVVHQYLSERYLKNNDITRAIHHYKEYTSAAKQTIAARDTRKILELQAEHDRLKAAYQEYRRLTLLTTLILVLTATIFIITVQARRIIRRNRKNIRQQAEANARLEEANGTLETRVGNQQKHLNQYKVICRIDEGHSRIEREDLTALNLSLLLERENHIIHEDSEYTALFHWADIAYRQYHTRLKEAYPDLKHTDLSICCLLRIGYSIPECARIMNTSEAGIRKRIQRMYPILDVQDRQTYLDVILERKNSKNNF